jgi:hypothetical protein
VELSIAPSDQAARDGTIIIQGLADTGSALDAIPHSTYTSHFKHITFQPGQRGQRTQISKNGDREPHPLLRRLHSKKKFDRRWRDPTSSNYTHSCSRKPSTSSDQLSLPARTGHAPRRISPFARELGDIPGCSRSFTSPKRGRIRSNNGRMPKSIRRCVPRHETTTVPFRAERGSHPRKVQGFTSRIRDTQRAI